MNALTFATAQLIRALPRARMGGFLGDLAERQWPPAVGKVVVGCYSRIYGVELDDCVDRSWGSFDAFFTRALRGDARPVEGDVSTLVSPADGRVESAGRLREGGTLVVKGRPYSVGELLGSEGEAQRYRDGWGCVVYLSPRDYHRVHCPVDGVVTEVRSIQGDYFPVNAVGVAHVPGLFVRNRRVALRIETPHFGTLTLVMVAAMIVGRITVSGVPGRDVPYGLHQLEQDVRRGEELGAFHLGSTAVLLAEERALEGWSLAEGAVRVGQALGRARPKGRNP